jgi:hypothetical protein
MPKTIQKQSGVDQLKPAPRASLNAWLNLPKTIAVLGPVGGGHPGG